MSKLEKLETNSNWPCQIVTLICRNCRYHRCLFVCLFVRENEYHHASGAKWLIQNIRGTADEKLKINFCGVDLENADVTWSIPKAK